MDKRLTNRNADKSYKARPAKLTVLKHTANGTLVFSTEKTVRKINEGLFNESFSFITDNSFRMLGYFVDVDKPELYLLTAGEEITMNKIETPAGYFLSLSGTKMINRNTCLIPYSDTRTGRYGIATIFL
jgi:hypothetical protein